MSDWGSDSFILQDLDVLMLCFRAVIPVRSVGAIRWHKSGAACVITIYLITGRQETVPMEL